MIPEGSFMTPHWRNDPREELDDPTHIGEMIPEGSYVYDPTLEE